MGRDKPIHSQTQANNAAKKDIMGQKRQCHGCKGPHLLSECKTTPPEKRQRIYAMLKEEYKKKQNAKNRVTKKVGAREVDIEIKEAMLDEWYDQETEDLITQIAELGL